MMEKATVLLSRKKSQEAEARFRHVHRVWHDFRDNFIKADGKFTERGYPLRQQVERWAEQYPHDVKIITVDDSLHTSSSLVLIEHKNHRAFWGTTIIYIPQNNGEASEMMLYPRAVVELLEALGNIDKDYQRRRSESL